MLIYPHVSGDDSLIPNLGFMLFLPHVGGDDLKKTAFRFLRTLFFYFFGCILTYFSQECFSCVAVQSTDPCLTSRTFTEKIFIYERSAC